MGRLLTIWATAGFLWLLVLPTDLHAQSEPYKTDPQKQLDAWAEVLNFVEQQTHRSDITEDEIQVYLEDLNDILKQAQAFSARGEELMVKPLAELRALGPAPEETEPEEDPNLAAQRRTIEANLSNITGYVKQAELTIARSEQLLRRIGRIQREAIGRQVLGQGPSLVDADTWRKANQETLYALEELRIAVAGSWQDSQEARQGVTALLSLAVVILLCLGLAIALRPRLLRFYVRDPQLAAPSYNRRVLSVSARIVADTIVPVASLLALAYVLRWQGFVTGLFADMVIGIAGGISLYIAISQVARNAFAPDQAAWRIIPVTDQSARRLVRRLRALAVLEGLELAYLVALQPNDVLGPEAQEILAALFNLIRIVVLIAIVHAWEIAEPEQSVNQDATTTRRSFMCSADFCLRIAIAILLVVMPAIILLGYIRLGDYIIDRLLLVVGMAALYLLLRQIFREFATYLIVRHRHAKDTAHTETATAPDKVDDMLSFWSGIAIDIGLAIPTVYWLLVFWGVPESDMRLFVIQALQGIQIGELVISPTDIFWALVVFAVVWFLARRFQRSLTNVILPRTSLDEGVKQSLTGAVGYLGFALAITLAIATIGVDTASLAIIFGALSVGIGFGLQHVVNNFVSGLILLFQRPIKVGDWIVVGNNQGYVKRINVIGTEIETFDNAAVIVPNSNLVSSEVMNWHHHSKLGRVIIPVRATYDADPDQVRGILMDCAHANDDVLNRPEPFVLFQNFGVNALEFELRFYVREIDYYLMIASDMRYAIKKAFDEAGIEIPFPQQDVHLREPVALASQPDSP